MFFSAEVMLEVFRILVPVQDFQFAFIIFYAARKIPTLYE